ncbi:DNA replication ATP-dependent helicase/nuclease DNA2 [Galdieria sulphuraria]|nr:DNA replication ATP-dependent helicase/nuclease DNA2 [Galdieria sulphuraria]
MDRFVFRGSGRAAPQSNEKEEQVIALKKSKTNRKRNMSSKTIIEKRKAQVPLKQDAVEPDNEKENQKEWTETMNVKTPFPDDLEDIGSQLVIWKDDPSIPQLHSSKNMELEMDNTTLRIDQPSKWNTQHDTEQEVGFSSPELFQFWKRHGVSRLNIKRKKHCKSRQQEQTIENENVDMNFIRDDSTKSDVISIPQPNCSSVIEHREETISSLLESCEELTPDIVLSLEEWFRKYEQIGPTQASSERLRVVNIQDNEENRTKLVHLRQVTDECKSLSVLLCDQWYNTNVYEDDIVRIVQVDENTVFQPFPKKFSNDWQIRVDEKRNFFVLHPDTLISVTCLSNSFTCMRRALLAEWNRFAGVDSISALEGAMIHSLIETGLQYVSKENSSEKNGSIIASLLSSLMEQANNIVDAELENLYELSADDQLVRSLLQALVPQIVKWLEISIVKSDSSLKMECYGMGNMKADQIRMIKAESVEETIWSPIWGLKGKIDAIFQIEIEKNQVQQVPFELKTITEHHSLTPSIAHRAQLLLYSLLLSDRNDQYCDKGLLNYFVRKSHRNSRVPLNQQTVLIASTRAELVGLLMTRNEMVRYDFRERESVFPPLLQQSEAICKKCSVASSCMILHKLLENGTEDTTRYGPGVELFTQNTWQLTQNHTRYFQYWFHVLRKEEQFLQQTRQGIWTLNSEERERQGNCFGSLELLPREDTDKLLSVSENKTGRWRHTFRRQGSAKARSFLGSNIVLGDYVVVSGKDAKNQWKVGLARGFVCGLSDDSVTVQLDSQLYENSNRQSLLHIVEWRVDKDEMVSGWAIVKTNLQCLFLPQENDGFAKLRSLIVDLEPPRLDRQLNLDFSHFDIYRKLNEEQRNGIVKAFQSLDYMLVHGMPGTGKTAWIVALVEIAVQRGLSVLLCGHTHASVDNILLRLKQQNVSFLRLGRYDLIHHQLWDSCLYSPDRPKPKSVKEWKQVLESPLVVATTCMGVSHVIFSKRKFDLVVVDEAGQIAEPVCLGPLRMTKGSFVLVGDPYQLPPLMRASKWKDSVQSLFERLCLEHPEATVTLCKQYRMAEDIMQLSNQLIYSNQLQCADEQVANRCLATCSNETICSYPEWLQKCIDGPSRVIFLDTDALPAREIRNKQDTEETMFSDVTNTSTIHWNPQEAALIVKIVSTLHLCGVALEDIGIISPYRAQCSYLCHQLPHWRSRLEIKTVDQFQGRDKPCIILSFVRSNDEKRVGSLLRDWRRLNVAFTRAQSKCIFVGSLSTLKESCPFLAKFTSLLQQRDWIVSIPKEEEATTNVGIDYNDKEITANHKL